MKTTLAFNFNLVFVFMRACTPPYIKETIDDEYRVNMILDNLPAAMVRIREDNGGAEVQA